MVEHLHSKLPEHVDLLADRVSQLEVTVHGLPWLQSETTAAADIYQPAIPSDDIMVSIQ